MNGTNIIKYRISRLVVGVSLVEIHIILLNNVDRADSNAAFNIANRSEGIGRLQAERDVCKGSTDTPRGAMVNRMPPTPEPHGFSRGSMSDSRLISLTQSCRHHSVFSLLAAKD